MTRCYECLGQGIMGVSMNLYYVWVIRSTLALPHHNSCAAALGLECANYDNEIESDVERYERTEKI